MSERCDWRDFLEASDDTATHVIEALDEHFRHYLSPNSKCPGCNNWISATFRWALTRGQGLCGECGWPATGHHFIKDKDGQQIMSLTYFCLLVHPDFVESARARGEEQ